jgi:hypothetical protein
MSHTRRTSAPRTYPRSGPLDFLGLDDLVAFNIIDFRHLANSLDDAGGKLPSIAIDLAIEDMSDPTVIIQVGVLGMCKPEEIVVVIKSRQRQILLQHDNVRVIDKSVRSFMLCDVKGGKAEWETLACIHDHGW